MRLLALAVGALLLVPALARADDDEATAPTSTLDPAASSTITDEDLSPKQIILRRLVKSSGNIVFSPNFLIGHNPFTEPTGQVVGVTGEAIRVYAAAGFGEKLTIGAAYSMVLNDGVGGTSFSARGPLTLYGSYELVRKGPLDVVAGGEMVVDLAAVDSSGKTATHLSLRGGATARLTMLKKVAVYTGNPLAGTPQAHQLSIGLYSKARDTLSLPLGVAVQATPEVYAYVETNIADIYFANGPKDAMGNTRHSSVLFSDLTPIILGGFYSPSGSIDLGGALQFGDLGDPKYFVITIGARFHTGP